MFPLFNKEKREKIKDQKEIERYNRRQEKLDSKVKEAKQTYRFKSVLAKLKFETYTKRLVGIIVIVSLVDLQLSYILAFMDKIQIAETLSGQICTTILGVSLIYMIRAYFDTKAEKNNDKIQNAESIEKKISKDLEETVLSKMREVIANSGLSEHVNLSDFVPEDPNDDFNNGEPPQTFG